MGRFKVADRLNANQRRVLDLLLATKPYIIKFRDIADALAMREASVRTILRRLDALSFLSFHKARDGNIQGIRVAFNQEVIAQYQQDQTISQAENQSQSHPQNPTLGATPPPSPTFTHSTPHNPSASQSDQQNPSLKKIEKIENLSIENPFGWDDAFLELMWPHVVQEGFRVEQIRQILAAREKLGKETDRKVVALSLDRAEWELEEKGMLEDLATKGRVRNVASYIFTALARFGALRAHPDYVSREEQAAEEAVRELKKRREAAENLETARFEAYVSGLSREELEKAMEGFPGGNRDAWLRSHWRRTVRDAGGGE